MRSRNIPRSTGKRKTATRAVVLHHWGTNRKKRLLAMTGSRLNATRGFASSIHITRQAGHATAAGDRGWRQYGRRRSAVRPAAGGMASPKPCADFSTGMRMPLFDAVIFDEASQCRLEECCRCCCDRRSCHRGRSEAASAEPVFRERRFHERRRGGDRDRSTII